MRCLPFVLVLITPLRGLAQVPGTDDDARKLFIEARGDMDRGEWGMAKDKLEASYARLPGKGVAFNLAVCLEHLGKLTRAHQLYRQVSDAERSSGDDARAKIADEHAAAVHARLSHLRVESPPSLHATVRIDGAPAGDSDLELDPGMHTIHVAGHGFEAWHDSVELAEGEHRDIVVPALQPLSAPTVPLVARPTPLVADVPRAHSMRTAGFVTGGVGIASLAASAGFAIASAALYSSSATYCDGTTNVCTSQRGVDLRNQSLSLGDASTGTVIAGVALVIAGTVMWIVDGRHRR